MLQYISLSINKRFISDVVFILHSVNDFTGTFNKICLMFVKIKKPFHEPKPEQIDNTI